MSIMLPLDLDRFVNKKIDNILYEIVFECEDEIYKKNYSLAKDILDSLLYWRDIRGDVVDCSDKYLKLDRRINNVIEEIIKYNFNLEND